MKKIPVYKLKAKINYAYLQALAAEMEREGYYLVFIDGLMSEKTPLLKLANNTPAMLQYSAFSVMRVPNRIPFDVFMQLIKPRKKDVKWVDNLIKQERRMKNA